MPDPVAPLLMCTALIELLRKNALYMDCMAEAFAALSATTPAQLQANPEEVSRALALLASTTQEATGNMQEVVTSADRLLKQILSALPQNSPMA